MKKVISILVLMMFLVNSVSYGVGVAPASLDPVERENIRTMARVLWGKNRGSELNRVTRDIANVRRKIENHEFVGEAPEIAAVIGHVSSATYPLLLEGGGTTQDIITAIEDFCVHKTSFKQAFEDGRFSVRESSFAYDKKGGEIPISRLEGKDINNCRLAVHSWYRAVSRDILDHDIGFSYKFDDYVQYVSLARGFLNVTVRHYLRDTERDYKGKLKSGGHLVGAMQDEVASERDANNISGRYAFVNDAIKLWFLASYAFSDATRYNNDVLAEHLRDIYEHKEEYDFANQFPNLNDRNIKDAFDLVLFINYHYFNRMDEDGKPVRVREIEDIEIAVEGGDINVLAYMGAKDKAAEADKQVLKDFIMTGLKECDPQSYKTLYDIAVNGMPQEIPGEFIKSAKWFLEHMVFKLLKTRLRTVGNLKEFVKLLQSDDIRKILKEKVEKTKKRTNLIQDDNLADVIEEELRVIDSCELKTLREIAEEKVMPGKKWIEETFSPDGWFCRTASDIKSLMLILRSEDVRKIIIRVEEEFREEDKKILTKRINQIAATSLFDAITFEKIIDGEGLDDRGRRYITYTFLNIDSSEKSIWDQLNTVRLLKDLFRLLREDDMKALIRERIRGESQTRKLETPKRKDKGVNTRISDLDTVEAEKIKKILKTKIEHLGENNSDNILILARIVSETSLNSFDEEWINTIFGNYIFTEYGQRIYYHDIWELLKGDDMLILIEERKRAVIKLDSVKQDPNLMRDKSEDKELLKKKINEITNTSLFRSVMIERVIGEKELSGADVQYLMDVFYSSVRDRFKTIKSVADLLKLLREDDMVAFIREKGNDLTIAGYKEVLKNRINQIAGTEKFNYGVFYKIVNQETLSESDALYLSDTFRDCSGDFSRADKKGALGILLIKLLREIDMGVFISEKLEKIQKDKVKKDAVKQKDEKTSVRMEDKDDFDNVISECILQALKRGGSDAVMALNEKYETNIEFSVQRMHKTSMEIIVPFHQTKSLRSRLIAIRREMKKRGKSLIVVRYNSEKTLRKLLRRGDADKDVKRIVISDSRMERVIRQFIRNDSDVKLLRNVRVINMKIPRVEKGRETALQAQIVIIAILARLLTDDNSEQNLCVKAVLEDMLDRCFPTRPLLKKFMKNLVISENKQITPKQIHQRVFNSLQPTSTISLIKELDHKLRVIEYFMKFA